MEKYSEYKDSGVEWLGEIPSHWNIVATQWVANLYTGDSLNEKQKERYSEFKLDSIPYVSSKDISLQTEDVDYENGLYIPITEKKFKVASKNSFLLCIEGGSAGRKHAFLSKDVCFVNKLCCFDSKINSRFHYYFIQSFYFRSMFTRNIQGLIGGVSPSTIKNFYTLIPPLSEQKLIASYLDTQTSKIDEAISQQQKMIDLLNERKQTIINNAITKGLDPNVPMKDSGVDWIGMIPEHWKLNRLKTILHIKDKRNMDPNALLLSLYTAIGVRPRHELEERGNKAITVVNYKIVNQGDLVVNRLLAWMGAYGLSNYNGVTSPDYDVYSFSDNVNREYYESLFRNTQFKSDCFRFGHGIMLMRWRTYPDAFLNINVPIPPKEEQNEIFKFLAPQIKKIEESVDVGQRMISLLQERKQIIINEVVTGKIKVS